MICSNLKTLNNQICLGDLLSLYKICIIICLEGIFMDCPVCGCSDKIIKNGYKLKNTKDGVIKRQRYRCKTCKITFYDPNDYKKLMGKKDIRVNLLGIILKHSFFDLQELNQFFGYNINSSQLSVWEKSIINEGFLEVRPKYIKSQTNYCESKKINTKKNVISDITQCKAKKGIFITLDNYCCISDIDVFDESANPEPTCTTPKQTNSSQKE